MNKSISSIQFAFSFAGCFLGAGFVSGQELWQYFGSYGIKGIAGVLLAIALIGLISYFIMMITLRHGFSTMAAIIVGEQAGWRLKAVIDAAAQLLFLSVACIMIAGIGAMGSQLLDIPSFVFSLLGGLAAGLAAYFGLRGMVAVFTASVPVLIVSAVIIVILQITRAGGMTSVHFTGGGTNPLLRSWIFSLINYAGLNIFGSVGILAPVAEKVGNKKSITSGLAIGTVMLMILALSLLSALATAPESILTELPMMAVAQGLSRYAGWIYGILLFMGMFGNAVSSFVAILLYFGTKFRFVREHRCLSAAGLTVTAFAASLVGFSGLMGTLYPLYGYFGIAVMVLITVQYLISNSRS